MPLTRREAQILSWVSLTLLMLAPRGIEAWLPTTGCPQALHRHSLIASKPPWDTSTTPLSLLPSLSPLQCSYLWFHTGISVNTCEHARPLWFTKTNPHRTQIFFLRCPAFFHSLSPLAFPNLFCSLLMSL